jgi:hypothetical protein
VDTGHDLGQSAANGSTAGGTGLELLVDTLGNQTLASGVLDLLNTFLGVARKLEHLNFTRLEDGLQLRLELWRQIFGSGNVNLVDDEENELVREEGLDASEKLDLGLNSVTALLGQIHKVHDGRSQVSNSRDTICSRIWLEFELFDGLRKRQHTSAFQ